MDLETVQKKVDATNNNSKDQSEPVYANLEEFKKDISLIFENARIYNQPATIYYKYAQQLETIVQPLLKRLREDPVLVNEQDLVENKAS
jgi:bromodomain-containing protein 9